jgi:peptide/nickel transport system ATP-binding protein
MFRPLEKNSTLIARYGNPLNRTVWIHSPLEPPKATVPNLLQIRNLKVDFQIHGGVVHAVQDFSFDVRPGKIVALVGESGSGKSVTAQAIMGLLPAKACINGGEILFFDSDTPDKPPIDLAQLRPESDKMRAVRGARIAMIFQDAMACFSHLHTIGDQVSEALFLHRDVSKKEGWELTEQMLGLVGFLDPVKAMHLYPFELSGGLRQRAMIAMALVCRPSLVIADESTTALDVSIQAQILKLIKDLREELNLSVLMITHDLGVVANVADEVVVVYQGHIMESGTVEDIFTFPRHPYLKALLNAVPQFDMKNKQRLVPVSAIEHSIGPLITGREPWPETENQDAPMLLVGDLNKSFVSRKGSFFGVGEATVVDAVRDVNFTVNRGECFGLIGESGSGKSTVSRCIMRALTPDSGQIVFNDRGSLVDLAKLDDASLVPYRRKIQMVFQEPFSSLNPRMTIFDVIREPLIIHQVGDEETQKEIVKELMMAVGLDPRFLNRYPHSFSGGQAQRIGIARALALKPDLLVFDEPVSSLDVSIQAQVLNLLRDLQDELELTYLFVSHNLAVVNYVADHIAVMCRGRLVEMASHDALFREPVHPYTRALMAAVPFADLNRRLDFSALMDGRMSEPMAWPKPFTVTDETSPQYVQVGDSHFVLTSSEEEGAVLAR